MRELLMVMALGACASNGIEGTTDATPRVDSSADTTQTLTCLTKASIARAPDGSRGESYQYFALVSDIGPLDNYMVERCDLTTTYFPTMPGGCPSGYTCTVTGDAYPTGQACSWSKEGTFVGTVLVISCGLGSKAFNAAGTQTNGNDLRWGTVSLHRL